MRLWIGHLDPDTTEDELREFLGKSGDGSRPG